MDMLISKLALDLSWLGALSLVVLSVYSHLEGGLLAYLVVSWNGSPGVGGPVTSTRPTARQYAR
jgi:hypothetical protein